MTVLLLQLLQYGSMDEYQGYNSEKLEITGKPASWMASIGGVLARVEPKLRGEITLDPNVKDDDGICCIKGCLGSKIKCQALRVDMTHPNGEVTSVLIDTDERGCFVDRFKCPDMSECKKVEKTKLKRKIFHEEYADLAVDQRTNCPPKRDNTDKQTPIVDSICVVPFQAHIFNAKQIAPSSSNAVHWRIKKN